MSIAELLVIALVAMVVFSAKKLPELSRDLAKLHLLLQSSKHRIAQYWQEWLHQYQLEVNQQKAQQAEQIYYQEASDTPRDQQSDLK